ncbi:MAG TPA: DNA polymerase III subunit [Polyangiaceae bacterium]
MCPSRVSESRSSCTTGSRPPARAAAACPVFDPAGECYSPGALSFSTILGQAPALATLRHALSSGRVHHAYRFEGPPGVGKELAAFELARALVCERAQGEGCGECSACKRAGTLSEEPPHVPLHPDVVLLEKGLYRSVLGSGASEATGIGIEQVRRVVLTRAGFPPHEGRALVFIVREADEITVQAANALLKTLEEPHAGTHFILLTSRPSRLLDTIRSRSLPVRFAPLSDSIVAELLARRGADPSVAPLAQGSMSVALELVDPDARAEREAFVTAALEAITAPDLTAGLKLAEGQKRDRDGLRSQLAFLAQALAAEARAVLGSDVAAAERRALQYDLVRKTLDEVEKNVQPALALEAMVVKLRAL